MQGRLCWMKSKKSRVSLSIINHMDFIKINQWNSKDWTIQFEHDQMCVALWKDLKGASFLLMGKQQQTPESSP